MILSDYARALRDWKVRYALQSPDEPVHARFVETCHKLDQTEYYLDILCAGDSHERAEVVQQQMADGKLDSLRRRLEEIYKEDIPILQEFLGYCLLPTTTGRKCISEFSPHPLQNRKKHGII